MDFLRENESLVRTFASIDGRWSSKTNEILMELSFEAEVERLQVAEEAVRIVKKFNSGGKNKKERNDRLVHLCTEIANIIDKNKRLERVVHKQESELERFRAEGTTSVELQADTKSQKTPTTEDVRQHSSPATPSSGRGTSNTTQEAGTDPLLSWPERPSNQSRATSPLKSSGFPSRADSDEERTLTQSRATSPLILSEEWSRETQSRGTSPIKSWSSRRGSDADLEFDDMDHHGEDGYTDDFASEESERKENDDQSEAEFEKNEEEGEENTKSHEEHQQRTSPEGLPPAERQPDRGKKTKPKATSIRKPAKRKEREKHKEEQANDSNWKQEKGKDREKKQEKIGKLVKGEKSKKQKRGEREDHGKTSKDNRKSTSPKEPRKTQNESKHQRESPDAKSTANKKESQTGSRNEEPKTNPRPPRRRARNVPKMSGRVVSGNSAQWYSSESSSGSEESEDDDITRKIRPELTTEYWEIHRLVKYLRVMNSTARTATAHDTSHEDKDLKVLINYDSAALAEGGGLGRPQLSAGNPTVTIIALCALQDFSIEQEGCQLSLLDLRAAPVLLNLLNTDNYSCMIGSLQLLRRLSCSKFVNLELYRLGGVEQLVSCLESSSFEVQSLAAATLANLVSFGKAYSAVRKGRGIRKLVELLKPGDTKSVKVHTRRYTNDHDHSTLRRNACNALWSCSKSSKNITAIRTAGTVPILASLLTSGKHDLQLPAVGIIQECSNDTVFRGELRKHGMIQEIVQLLIDGSEDMKALCASAIDKCAEDEETRELVLKHGGLDPMVDVLATRPCKNAELLAAVAGALWKCAEHGDSMRRLERLGTVNHLITQVKLEHSLPVMSNLIGALGQFAYCKRNILTIHEEKVLDILIQKLNLTEPSILINSNALLARCAKENALRSHILTSDGLRLLWSLLKFSNPKVVASAADAISMCAVKPEESAEMIRSFVGGLELVTALLKSNRREILLGVCRLIINIGQDRENMSIMTDYGVIPLLVTLIDTPDDEEMRRYVAEAIATCCNLDKNIPALSPTVVPLTDGLSTFKSVEVHKATALALEKLSQDSRNCALICKHGARKHLMIMMASSDETVQNAAARCIKNVRMNTVNANS